MQEDFYPNTYSNVYSQLFCVVSREKRRQYLFKTEHRQGRGGGEAKKVGKIAEKNQEEWEGGGGGEGGEGWVKKKSRRANRFQTFRQVCLLERTTDSLPSSIRASKKKVRREKKFKLRSLQ